MGNHSYELALVAGVLSPFVSFWLLVFFGPRLGKPASGWLGVMLGMGVPLALATYVLLGWLRLDPAAQDQLTANAFRYHWANLGSVAVTVGVKLDSLTVAMYFMVTFIAFWIFFFSVGYMSGHSDEVAHRSMYHRFFAYLSLFGFSMLGLVISSSLLFLFIFWELVGLCSYLLIGFYFTERIPQYAQMKAFIVNRVGDFGFLIGLMLVYFQLGTLDLDQAAINFAKHYEENSGIFASSFTMLGWSLATIMGIGLFCGAMGKSAQFPLHVWLPDAMAGPTPVSALIHAATMVAAGVYLVARVFRLMTPDALMFISTIGCLTLFLMALIAIVQNDIKKCLAYSTLSQLGYMIFGLGCGAWIAALFHLITHAFFKAMMFLGSGQVIEGCHHEQDMRKMGGLIKKMPITGITFLIGVLAIAGTGIPGTKIGLGGFFSKDEILAVAYTRAFEWDDPSKIESQHGESHGGGGHANGMLNEGFGMRNEESRAEIHHSAFTIPHSTPESRFQLVSDPHATDPHATPKAGQPVAHREFSKESMFSRIPPLPKWMFWLAIITAYVTPFYMMRAWWLTFMGKPRDHHVYDHAHESPLMYIPLVVLAIGTAVSSYFIFRDLISGAAQTASAAPLVLAIDGDQHTPAIAAAHHWLKFGVGLSFAIGFVIAIAIYSKGISLAERIRRLPGVSLAHFVLVNKYFIDELYDLVFVRGTVGLARICRFVDTWIVDLFFNLLASGTERFAAFSGNVLDKYGIDGFFNGISDISYTFSDYVRGPQTGRIRNYVLFAAGAATIIVVALLWFGMQPGHPVTTAAALVP